MTKLRKIKIDIFLSGFVLSSLSPWSQSKISAKLVTKVVKLSTSFTRQEPRPASEKNCWDSSYVLQIALRQILKLICVSKLLAYPF